MRMTYDSMMLFAETWIAAWNRRDVDAVLAHFADDAEFVSPAAHKFVGRSALRSRKRLGTTGGRRWLASRLWNSSSITRAGTNGDAN